jgi:F-type H+-transporting ATPase subunit delta
MSARASAARYARALLDVAVKEADPEQVGRDLAAFAELVRGHAGLRDALTNPVVPAEAKQRVVSDLVAKQGLKPPVSKLLLMLAERDRMAILPDLVHLYTTRLEEFRGIVRAQVTAATELSAEQAAQLQQRLSTATGRTVTLTTSVDPSLIGGVVARIGSTVYDGSVAAQLEKMREKLLSQM